MDVAYLNIRGTFYFIASVLDGYSRSVVHWDIREKMEECDIESILQRAREKYPGVTPRIITDNGPQFIAKDFKQFIRICGMTHVRTSPYYPQSNGKIERYHRTLNGDCVRPKVPLSKDDALRVVGEFVREYNEERLHSALGYVTPKDMLKGRQAEIHAARDQKLSKPVNDVHTNARNSDTCVSRNNRPRAILLKVDRRIRLCREATCAPNRCRWQGMAGISQGSPPCLSLANGPMRKIPGVWGLAPAKTNSL